MANGDQEVRFTVKELLASIKDDVHRIEQKLDGRLSDHEQRLTALETKAQIREFLPKKVEDLELDVKELYEKAITSKAADDVVKSERKKILGAATGLIAVVEVVAQLFNQGVL